MRSIVLHRPHRLPGFLLFGLLWILPQVGQTAESVEKPPIFMMLGEQRLLRLPGLARFSLGESSVRAQPLPSSRGQPLTDAAELLLIKAVHEGPSDLWVWKKDGSSEHRVIRVDPPTSEALSPRLSRAINSLSEVEVDLTQTGVLLRGTVHSLDEAQKIASLARGFLQEVKDETEPAPELVDQGETALNAWLTRSPYAAKLELTRADQLLTLQLKSGSLQSPLEKSQIEKHARSIFPAVVLDFDTLPDASPTVHFKVFLLELRKNRFGALGLGWPGSQDSAFRVTTSSIQNLLQLDVALQALEGDGSLKILSNPELVVRAPGDAELFSGGEIPIESKSAYFSNVTWKNFGLLLQLHVTHSAGDRVRLDIATEVSHLDPSLMIEKTPGLQANRMKTQIDAQYGKPLLLSGLLQQDMRKQAQGLPFLRNLPVLGELFGSQAYQDNQTELVAILIPSKEPPRNAMEKIVRMTPKGPVPPPRQPANFAEEARLRASSDYPWNVLQ